MYLYLEKDSLFHRLHPVTKLLLLVLLIGIPFFAPGLDGIGTVFCVYILLLLAAGAWPNLKKFGGLIVIFWVATFLIWIAAPIGFSLASKSWR